MNNSNIQRDAISLKTVLMSVGFLTMTVLATTVKAEDLTVYSSLAEPVEVHNEKADYKVGHIRLRDSDLSFIQNGDVVGHGHSISFVVHHDKKTDTDTREFLVLTKLPEGTFWVKDVIEVPNKVVKANPVTQISGNILGGTQGYQGITGTYESKLTPDGKAFMTVYHIVRPK
jgi:hypothetical protein